MSSPPPSPTSPRHRRRHSSISISSGRHSLSRRSSAAYSPVTSRLGSSHGYGGNLADEFAELNGGGGMESLADELGGWDEEDVDEEGEFFTEAGAVETGAERDSGIDIASSPPTEKMLRQTADKPTTDGMLDPETAKNKKAYAHQRKPSDYDGSGYGSESDLEATELISASLEARLAAVEAMARRRLEENGSEADKTIHRFTEALAGLGGQSGIETGVTRLTTAHTSLSTHLSHQTRLLQQTTSTLLSPLAPPLHPDLLSDLLPQIATTLSILPAIQPAPQPSHALHALVSQTADLTSSLSHIADTLQMNRQATLTAARRMRAVRDVLADWRREQDEHDAAVRSIERGGWDGRLKSRACARECGEVLGGFEDVCRRWRQRIVEAHGGGGATVAASEVEVGAG